tara:strand:+ start:2980 stop:4434 length:1455 start_codon:yes stop_codon:yes gene_type:complete
LDQKYPPHINFGTDGWRGIIGFDFHIANLSKVAVAASQELKHQYFDEVKSLKVLIGYDRRFMADQFAAAIVPYVKACGLEPILSSSYVTTPSCSFYAREMKFLGALVITASHNPYNWLGLKIKSFRGCSVNESFTQGVEKRLNLGNNIEPLNCEIEKVDIKKFHLERIRSLFNTKYILKKLQDMKLRVFIDSMHGSAANSFNQLFESNSSNVIQLIRENADAYFGGRPPEPLLNNLGDLKNILNKEENKEFKNIGIVFDGDGDRISVIDEKGRYCSTQVLLPYFIDYLGKTNNNLHPVLKTVSGSDIIKNISESQNREVFELPVGFKFIADKMINEEIFIGGEESGGVGFGDFLPERDAIYASMILLSGIADQSKYLHQSLDEIQELYGPSFYDRIDIYFPDDSKKNNLKEFINKNIPEKICEYRVKNVSRIDGIKLRLDINYWLLFRFSGTEPLLRLYCEAPSMDVLRNTLQWSQRFIEQITE